MEISSLFIHKPILLPHYYLSTISPIAGKKRAFLLNRKSSSCALSCHCSQSEETTPKSLPSLHFEDGRRRALIASFLALAAGNCFCNVASAVSTSKRALRGAKIPESEYTTLPNGLKYMI